MTGDTSDLEVLTTDSTSISGEDLIGIVGGKLRLLSIDGGHLKHIVEHDLQTATQRNLSMETRHWLKEFSV
ncbi:hypothetical protein N9H39_00795 [Gammaproteobacteria bacterium]|nr:hypothetical protein [Gammaproteobacteria bacterium]